MVNFYIVVYILFYIITHVFMVAYIRYSVYWPVREIVVRGVLVLLKPYIVSFAA